MTTEPTQDSTDARPDLAAISMLSTMTGGNTIGGALREKNPRADGYRHIDTPALIEKLKALNVNHYTFGIWDSPTDWDDLRLEFLPAAAKAGLTVLAYLVPPSESQLDGGKASRPYNTDYVAWAKALAQLSVQQPALTGWAIDDFSFNQGFYTPQYLTQITNAYQAINPKLKFYTTAYYSSANDPAFLDKYGPFVDGFIYPYLGGAISNTGDTTALGPAMDTILAKFHPRNLELILLIYTQRYIGVWPEPTPDYVNRALQVGIPYLRDGRISGIIAYGTQIDDAPTVTASNKAMYGNGRLAFMISDHTPTAAGAYAQASQVVKVDPKSPRYELSFWHWDHYARTPSGIGYHFKQVILDGTVVYESDVMDGGSTLWMQGQPLQGPIDVTSVLKGKSQATLIFRLLDKQGVGDFPLDVGFDHVETIGFTVTNPDFENTDGWTLTTTHQAIQPLIDLWVPDRPKRIFQAVSQQFGAARSISGS